jgi:hypothetical protein
VFRPATAGRGVTRIVPEEFVGRRAEHFGDPLHGVKNEGARSPRPIILRKFREISSSSASFSCVSLCNRHTCRSLIQNLLQSLLSSKSLRNAGTQNHQHKVCVSGLHTLYVRVILRVDRPAAPGSPWDAGETAACGTWRPFVVHLRRKGAICTACEK